MVSYRLKITSQEQAERLNEIVRRFTCQADLRQDNIRVDARSILGTLSLDFRKPVFLEVYDGCRSIRNHLGEMLVE